MQGEKFSFLVCFFHTFHESAIWDPVDPVFRNVHRKLRISAANIKPIL